MKGPEGLISIYALSNPSEIEGIFRFSLLISFVHLWGCLNIVMFSNFNSVLHDSERWGVNSFGSISDDLVNLSLLIHCSSRIYCSLVLHSLLFFGSNRTATRNCLDRFLISCKIGSWYDNMVQKAYFCFILDYVPIMLFLGQLIMGPHPFKAFNVWCQDRDDHNLLALTWEDNNLLS